MYSTMISDSQFEDPNAGIMEVKRADKRKTHRLIYDCLNARVLENHTVDCRKGVTFRIRGDGTIPLISVLRGMTPSECRKCEHYDPD